LGSPITVAGTHSVQRHTSQWSPCRSYQFTGIDDEGDFTYDYDVIISNQLVASAGNDVARDAMAGTITWTETCTWIVAADVLSWLGISVATANDTAFVTVCTEAANAWAYKARKMAGYQAESLYHRAK
jgi:thiosulfate reductase cytochrome b subunit